MIIATPNLTKVVTDHTFRFVGGDQITLTLADGDTYTQTVNGDFELRAYSETAKTAEITTFYARHVIAHTVRKREIDVFAPGQSPLEKAIAEEDARTTPRTRTLPREGATE